MLPECPYAVIQKTALDDSEHQTMLNWFNENVKHPIWRVLKPSMTGVCVPPQDSFSISNVEAIWCFADKQEALMFKLAWGGENNAQ